MSRRCFAAWPSSSAAAAWRRRHPSASRASILDLVDSLVAKSLLRTRGRHRRGAARWACSRRFANSVSNNSRGRASSIRCGVAMPSTSWRWPSAPSPAWAGQTRAAGWIDWSSSTTTSARRSSGVWVEPRPASTGLAAGSRAGAVLVDRWPLRRGQSLVASSARGLVHQVASAHAGAARRRLAGPRAARFGHCSETARGKPVHRRGAAGRLVARLGAARARAVWRTSTTTPTARGSSASGACASPRRSTIGG